MNCVTYDSKVAAQLSEKPQSRFGSGQIRAVVMVGDAVKTRADDRL
jgi:hypothetical protein